MAKRTKAQQKAVLDSVIYDNNNEEIEAAKHNTMLTDFIETQMNELEPAADAALNMRSNKIVSVTDPTSDQDAATKKYVDSGSPVVGAEYYANGNIGNDSNIGTKVSPFETLEKALTFATEFDGISIYLDEVDDNNNLVIDGTGINILSTRRDWSNRSTLDGAVTITKAASIEHVQFRDPLTVSGDSFPFFFNVRATDVVTIASGQFMFCQLSDGTYTGGNVHYNGNLSNPTINLSSGTMYLQNCNIENTLTLTAGTLILVGCTLEGSIVQNGGTIESHGGTTIDGTITGSAINIINPPILIQP